MWVILHAAGFSADVPPLGANRRRNERARREFGENCGLYAERDAVMRFGVNGKPDEFLASEIEVFRDSTSI